MKSRPASPFKGILFIIALALAAPALNGSEAARAEEIKPKVGPVTGLPIPRFVSLKAQSVRFRVGPGRKYQIAWLYKRRGLPVEVIQEFDRWRKVRDSDGTTGWVLHSLLSGRRTVMVAPWDRELDDKGNLIRGDLHLARRAGDAKARPSARIEAGAVGSLLECEKGWCQIDLGEAEGWMKQETLWGTYPGEAVEG